MFGLRSGSSTTTTALLQRSLPLLSAHTHTITQTHTRTHPHAPIPSVSASAPVDGDGDVDYLRREVTQLTQEYAIVRFAFLFWCCVVRP